MFDDDDVMEEIENSGLTITYPINYILKNSFSLTLIANMLDISGEKDFFLLRDSFYELMNLNLILHGEEINYIYTTDDLVVFTKYTDTNELVIEFTTGIKNTIQLSDNTEVLASMEVYSTIVEHLKKEVPQNKIYDIVLEEVPNENNLYLIQNDASIRGKFYYKDNPNIKYIYIIDKNKNVYISKEKN